MQSQLNLNWKTWCSQYLICSLPPSPPTKILCVWVVFFTVNCSQLILTSNSINIMQNWSCISYLPFDRADLSVVFLSCRHPLLQPLSLCIGEIFQFCIDTLQNLTFWVCVMRVCVCCMKEIKMCALLKKKLMLSWIQSLHIFPSSKCMLHQVSSTVCKSKSKLFTFLLIYVLLILFLPLLFFAVQASWININFTMWGPISVTFSLIQQYFLLCFWSF